MDIRGDDSTVLNDSVLVGPGDEASRSEDLLTRWVELNEMGRASINFTCVLIM